MVSNSFCSAGHKKRRVGFGTLVLRLGLGIIFIAHGLQKLHGMEMTEGFFQSVGFASSWAHIVAYIELIGGSALILGLFTRLASLLLSVVMAVVLLSVKGHAPIIGPAGVELELALFSGTAALIFLGSGKYGLGRFGCFCCKKGMCKKWCPCHVACDNTCCSGACSDCGTKSCDGCGSDSCNGSCGKKHSDSCDGTCGAGSCNTAGTKEKNTTMCDGCADCTETCTRHEMKN